MQRKHLIAFTLATIIMMLGFNIINSNRHEQNRTALLENDTPAVAEIDAVSNSNNNIVAQPLGEQPKTIIASVSADVKQAQKVEQQGLEQMSDAQ